jgi:hypothetical protein
MQEFPIPIVNLSNLYINGLNLLYETPTTISVGTGMARDSSDTYDIVNNESLTLNGAVNGANGLDTGSLSGNKLYYVFIIYDYSNTNLPAALLSLSKDSPVMPSLNGVTYAAYRRIGCVATDGTSEFRKFYTMGVSSQRYVQFDTPITVLTAGSSTTFSGIQLKAFIPFVETTVYLNAKYTPVTAASTANIRPLRSTVAAGSCPITLKGNVSAVDINFNMLKVGCLLNDVDPSLAVSVGFSYSVTASDSLTLELVGYDESL